MSQRLIIPYTEIPIPPSEAFPQGESRDYPIVTTVLSYQERMTPFSFYAVIDSGADHCVFPALLGRSIGIPVESGKRLMTAGVTGVGWAYYHHVVVYVKIQEQPYHFNCYAGFMPDLDMASVGLLGRHGFFDLFETVTFHTTKRFVELHLLAPSTAKPG